LVTLSDSHCQLIVVVAQSVDYHILLLETLFNNSDFLRVSEGVLASDDLFELLPEAAAFVDVKLHLNLNLSHLGRFDVPL